MQLKSKAIKSALNVEAKKNLHIEVKDSKSKTTTVMKKGVLAEPSIKHKPVDCSGIKFGISKGVTLNMENYQSLRADVWISDEVLEGETIQEALSRVDCILEEFLEKVQEEYCND